MDMRILVLLLFISSFSLFAQQDRFEGYWSGAMVLLGGSHELLMEVVKEKKKYTIHLLNEKDSTRMGISASKTTIKGTQFDFEIASLGVTYRGVLNDQQFIEGDFEQYGMQAKLNFHRERQEKIVVVRPQEPLPPFDYITKDLTFKHSTENLVFGGTLVLPKDTTQPFPIVVFSSGSGAQDRNEEMLGHKPFLIIADHLAKNGIGSFRFDDRGVGESQGQFQGTSLTQFATDLESAYLFVRSMYTDAEIGLIGHSEGSMHAQMTAVRQKEVAFIISLAGPGTKGRQIIEDQQYLIMIADGKSEEAAKWNQATFSGMLDIIDQNDQAASGKLLADYLGKQWDNAPDDAKQGQNKVNFIMGLAGFINNQFGREFSKWDPADYLPHINVPVLSLIGSKDFQVPAEQNTAGFNTLLNETAMSRSHIEILEGLNHLFQKCVKCTMMEYGELDETINTVVLDRIVEFIEKL